MPSIRRQISILNRCSLENQRHDLRREKVDTGAAAGVADGFQTPCTAAI